MEHRRILTVFVIVVGKRGISSKVLRLVRMWVLWVRVRCRITRVHFSSTRIWNPRPGKLLLRRQ